MTEAHLTRIVFSALRAHSNHAGMRDECSSEICTEWSDIESLVRSHLSAAEREASPTPPTKEAERLLLVYHNAAVGHAQGKSTQAECNVAYEKLFAYIASLESELQSSRKRNSELNDECLRLTRIALQLQDELDHSEPTL